MMDTQEDVTTAAVTESETVARSQTQQTPLLPKRGGSSVVWLYFGFQPSDKEQTQPICKLCSKAVPAADANTSGLFYHLKKNHEQEHGKLQPLRSKQTRDENTGSTGKKFSQPKLKEAFAQGSQYEKTSQRHKQITGAISRYICKGMAPVYIVEKDSFRDLVRTLDPRYVMPSRKHFSKVELPGLYASCRAEVEREVRSGATHYALTTDMWMSRATQPYMSLTIHFIKDWTLRARCLQTVYFPEDHTGVMLAQGMSLTLLCTFVRSLVLLLLVLLICLHQ